MNIYHYTSGQHLTKILESGELRVSEWEIKNRVRPPALWFSLNTIWEPTATKMTSKNGMLITLTKEEQHRMAGLYRFSIEFKEEKLCSWGRYKHVVSNTPLTMYRQMELSGIQKGANPKDWYASFKNIKLDQCVVLEKWDGKKWVIE